MPFVAYFCSSIIKICIDFKRFSFPLILHYHHVSEVFMPKPISTIFKTAFLFAGTMLGAGFASGQELLYFFIAYGSMGIYGIVTAGIFFSLLGYRLLKISNQFETTDYTLFIYKLCGKRFGFILNLLLGFFLFTILQLMLIAAGTICRNYFYLPFALGYTSLSLLILVLALFGVQGIMKVNLIATPFLALIILIICFSSLHYHEFSFSLFEHTVSLSNQPAPHWLLSCLLYASYNLSISLPLLVPLGAKIKCNQTRLLGSILGATLLMSLAICITFTILLHCPYILNAQIPMLDISCSQSLLHSFLYLIIFLLAIFTTSLSCLYGCASQLKKHTNLPYPLCLIFLLCISFFFINLEFSEIIQRLFPWFGYLALFIMIKLLLAKDGGRNEKNNSPY